MSMNLQRENLVKVYQAALLAVNGRECVSRSLVNVEFRKPLRIVAIGKAALAMAMGAIDMLDDHPYECLIISKQIEHTEVDVRNEFDLDQVSVLTAAHPVPDESSLVAGKALIEFIQQSPEETEFLFLISGGTSSLVEVLPEQVSLEAFKKVNQWLLSSGFNIEQINTVRKSMSCIKGGRLANLLGTRLTRCLIISDVPGDDLSVIGSGLLVSDANSVGDTSLETKLSTLELPDWIRELCHFSPRSPGYEDVCFKHLTLQIIANNSQAQFAAGKYAETLNYQVHSVGQQVFDDVKTAAKNIAYELIKGEPGIYIWGGETTIKLPENPGRGGRNQQLALEVAREISGHSDIILLVAATDGTDGPTSDAGGLVDGATLERGKHYGLSVETYVDNADAGTYLLATADLFTSGSTGTNVMDLIIGLKIQGSQV